MNRKLLSMLIIPLACPAHAQMPAQQKSKQLKLKQRKKIIVNAGWPGTDAPKVTKQYLGTWVCDEGGTGILPDSMSMRGERAIVFGEDNINCFGVSGSDRPIAAPIDP